MKNSLSSITEHLIQKYKQHEDTDRKSTNINVLLNRVKQGRKQESRKKLLFTAVTSLGVLLFGILVF